MQKNVVNLFVLFLFAMSMHYNLHAMEVEKPTSKCKIDEQAASNPFANIPIQVTLDVILPGMHNLKARGQLAIALLGDYWFKRRCEREECDWQKVVTKLWTCLANAKIERTEFVDAKIESEFLCMYGSDAKNIAKFLDNMQGSEDYQETFEAAAGFFAGKGSKRLVLWMLEKGANLGYCFCIACMDGQSDLAQFLIDRVELTKRKDIAQSGLQIVGANTANHCRLNVSDVQLEKIVDLLLKYVDINELAEDGRSPLIDVVYSGRLDLANLLLARGADVNRQGIPFATVPWGHKSPEVSALYEAVSLSHKDIVQTLLEYGAQVSEHALEKAHEKLKWGINFCFDHEAEERRIERAKKILELLKGAKAAQANCAEHPVG